MKVLGEIRHLSCRGIDTIREVYVAIIAQAGGGYAVELAGTPARRVSVQLGLFDHAQGLVQVTGGGLRAGQRVVIPSA